jgi:hypothetical protein
MIHEAQNTSKDTNKTIHAVVHFSLQHAWQGKKFNVGRYKDTFTAPKLPFFV